MSQKQISSFNENLKHTLAQQNNMLGILQSLQKSMTSNDSFIDYDFDQGDGTSTTFQLPSYTSLLNRLQALEKTIQELSSGKAIIHLSDSNDVQRTLKLQNAPKAPNPITNLSDPIDFELDSNWFFENLMFPGATVTIDLTGKIPDDADRVKVSRIILDSRNQETVNFWKSNLQNNTYDYVGLKSILSYNNIPYSEDEETIELPFVHNTKIGSFQIISDPETHTGQDGIFYKLDTLSYKNIDITTDTQSNNGILNIGDQLLYNDTIFSVTNVNQNTNEIQIKVIQGSAIPGIYTTFEYYDNPFRTKEIKVRFGAHEFDVIYIKAVNEDYNLIADTWSTPIKFDSDNLVYKANNNVRFADYYATNIVDWGANMIADAKQRTLKALYGHIPNAPSLLANDLRVVQVNTQINAAIDTADVKNTAAEIETTKSQINSLKSTIASQKTELANIVKKSEYDSMQQQIATNIVDLQNMQVSYQTLVSNLKNIVKDNQALNVTPKYHIRGFFPIPELKYRDADNTIPEEIIGFEIAYRYICEDNTGTQLNTFTYTGTDGQSKLTGTFTDWSMIIGKQKTRSYNNETGLYEWKAENVADGTEININQIDIPITKGEKVEIKVRSISEAGYPENPLRSEWSNSVVISFPDTLSTSNEIADLIKEINDDSLNIQINNIIDSVGLSSHIDDSIANTNSVKGLYYKHESKNIAYEDKQDNEIHSISVQEKLDNLSNINKGLVLQVNTLTQQVTDLMKEIQKLKNK